MTEPALPGISPDAFTPGLKLSELLFEQAVRPILERRSPGLVYSAALIGRGSEVLGFDTPQSMDHDWGPRLMLFLPEEGFEECRDRLDRALSRELPPTIGGIQVDLAYVNRSDGHRARDFEGPVRHGVTFHTVRGYFRGLLNADPTTELSVVDWLAIPQQYLRAVTSGRVFHDGLGRLEPIRAKLAYYPSDVWLYVMACQWRRIAQEEHFMGRCGQAGDELGSRVVASRLVRDLMGLCFLMERRYVPFIKWLGTAFRQLSCAGGLMGTLHQVLDAGTWQEREAFLVEAYEFVAGIHNNLGVTPRLTPVASPFYGRPFRVIHADRFAAALRAAIQSEEVRSLPPHLGSVGQFVDSTDVLDSPARLGRIKEMYAPGPPRR